MELLDGKEIEFKSDEILQNSDIVIADEVGPLALAGIKGGKRAEVDTNTKNVLIEAANFFPVMVRKSAKRLGVYTDSAKRFENDLSPDLCDFAMKEISGLFVEYGFTDFEEIVDVFPFNTFSGHALNFSSEKVSKILGLAVSVGEIEGILKRYNFEYKNDGNNFEIIIPSLRIDLSDQITQDRKDDTSEDMAEEIGRVIGYDKVKGKIPQINFKPKINEMYSKITWARNKLLNDGYSEVMTSTFRNTGEVSVLASASDKTFLRTSLSDGLKESLKLNQVNAPLLGLDEIKIFEIGTVFNKSGPARNAFSITDAGGEEMRVAYGDKKNITEVSLDEFVSPPHPSGTPPQKGGEETPRLDKEGVGGGKFSMWSLFPFIARDVAVWVPENVKSADVAKIIQENMGEMVVKGPELFDEFKKPASTQGGEGKTSYAFRLVFQSFDRTLTDAEVNDIMAKITNKIKENEGWQVR